MAKIIYHGNLAGSTDAVHMPSKKYQNGWIKAMPDNTGNVYIGSSSDVIPSGTTDTNITGGYPLKASEVFLLSAPGDLNELWYISDNAGDDLVYLLEDF